MPTATVELGDRADESAGWVGPYIGETLAGPGPSCTSTRCWRPRANRPTAIAITGEPGGGKTTLAMLLIYQLALRWRDGGGDRPQGRRGVAGGVPAARHGRKARVLPLNSAAPGLLDPFSFGLDLSEKRTMATETLRLLLPRMSEERDPR